MVVKAIVYGIATVFVITTVWLMLSPAVEEIAGFVENEMTENGIAYQGGQEAYTMFSVAFVVFIILALVWMYVYSHRDVYGRVQE